jgi:ATP adenylyltransferase
MKKLFSPWRSAYIETFKVPKKSRGCLFCRIARTRSDEANLVVFRGRHNFVVLNLFPYNSGHLMVVPYRHARALERIPEVELSEALDLVKRSIAALTKTSRPHGYNVGLNIGRVAGAGIESHVHFHVVPRWNGDTNFMPVLGETKVISEDLKQTWSQLRGRF